MASQSSHAEHFAIVEGVSLSCAVLQGEDGKTLSAALWLLALRVLYTGYSIIGLRKAENQQGASVLWCSWSLVSRFVDMLTDVITTIIPGTKVRADLGTLQLAELSFRTRLVEVLRATPESDIPLTFDEAFKQTLMEKQSLFHRQTPGPAAQQGEKRGRGSSDGNASNSYSGAG